jgi:cysteine desulfurase/selenocysteine lyase
VQSIGLDKIAAYEHELLDYAVEHIRKVPGVRIVGNAKHRAGVISFVIENPPIAAHDLGVALDLQGIAVRTGHHCCQPVMDRFGIPATARASFAMYNTRAEVDALTSALTKIVASETKARASAKPQAAAAVAGEVKYPPASAASVAAAADAVAEDFDLFSDREEKTQYVLDVAEKLPHTFELLKKTGLPRVQGCMSQVYLVARKVNGKPDAIEFVADSDAAIVRGLIAILERLFSGQSAREIIGFDHEAFFRRVGLDQFITTQRRNGLEGMVRRLKASATELTGAKG